ncbi:MAG TPA: 3-dehydroquinate synthase family protein, partial [Chloroflexota bacterium]|nr:3-dehydroquinate synthase family protein [Chloroflexota bacterium]
PTTILSQIDSAIGGKVAVNHAKGKNLIGAFYPAQLIVADVDTLRSLSPRELAAGWAEAIKCAMILDAPLLDLLSEHAAGLVDPDSVVFQSDLLVQIVDRCARHKVSVVEEDEREAGLRMILNYGHTIGQGLEAALNYNVLLHGEAVSIGMTAAAWLSVERGLLSWSDARRQRTVLEQFGLPTEFPRGQNNPTVDVVLDRIGHDKKAFNARLRWVLLDRIGHAVIDSNVPPELVRVAIENSLARELTA